MKKVSVAKDFEPEQDCILSDPTPDRYDDILEAKPGSWDLSNFRQNPIALLNHRSDFPIGTWKNVRVEDGALRGQLLLAPPGTSDRHDEIRKLIDSKILRGISVGFLPIKSEPRSDSRSGGTRYTKMELTECSVVSVPANPSAVMAVRSMGISRELQCVIFKEATIGERIRQARRAVRNARALASKALDPRSRAVLARAIAIMEKGDGLYVKTMTARSSSTEANRSARARDVRAKAQALLNRIDKRIAKEADAWGTKERDAQTVATFGEVHERLERQAKPDEGPQRFNVDDAAPRWRGQKLPTAANRWEKK